MQDRAGCAELALDGGGVVGALAEGVGQAVGQGLEAGCHGVREGGVWLGPEVGEDDGAVGGGVWGGGVLGLVADCHAGDVEEVAALDGVVVARAAGVEVGCDGDVGVGAVVEEGGDVGG